MKLERGDLNMIQCIAKARYNVPGVPPYKRLAHASRHCLMLISYIKDLEAEFDELLTTIYASRSERRSAAHMSVIHRSPGEQEESQCSSLRREPEASG